jgi:uncharacterized protein YhfF
MTESKDPKIAAYWQAFLETLPEGTEPPPDRYQAWGFGDSPEMADALGSLVKQGVKTATASLVWAYEAEDEPLPEIGDYSIILNSRGKPICIIQTSGVHICPFEEVDGEQAFLEGEGDRTLGFWREVHWEFFSRECAQIGREPSQTMPVLCERFVLVYPAQRSTQQGL